MTASTAGAGTFWAQLAGQTQAWLTEQGVAARDAIVLLPFAQLLAPARAAFAQAGGWQPRVETTRTLLVSLGPVTVSADPGHDPVADRLAGAELLRGQPWAAAWQRRDARAFERGVAAMAATAQAFVHAAHAQAPAQRAAWWATAREQLGPVSGPGASERALARIALEWAASADAPASDALFDLRPAAWVRVQAGATDALAASLLSAATVPTRLIDVDPPADEPPQRAPSLQVADHLEQEAQASAALVLQALHEGRVPVALVAQDRLVVRRVRALLERRGVALHDETGWKLSTTRSAALVMAALRAASPRATVDAALDWLKGEPDIDAQQVSALERHWRAARPLPDALHAWWQRTQARLAPLQVGGRLPLADWLVALAAVLPLARLAADEAGRQLLAALRLDGDGWAAPDTRFDLERFTAWVDDTLELHTYLPGMQPGAQVVITPLARVMLRPFAAVVCPGTDELRLGAPTPPHSLLGDAVLVALGLPDAATRRCQEQLAFAHLLRQPNVTLLRRRSDGGEPLARSPLVEQAFAGRELTETPVRLATRTVTASPVVRPAPHALAPERLSASAIEALRDCPYRFFARAVLRLREADELEAEIEKRDYGNWLHAVLHRFHSARAVHAAREDDLAALHASADASAEASGLDAAQLLPFRAAFEALAPRYIDWQRARDAAGWTYAEGEKALQRPLPGPPGSAPIQLYGRIDRIDAGAAGHALIDYKTSSVQALRQRVREPLEDTQLAVYATLLGPHTPHTAQRLKAFYLALDGRDGPSEVEHQNVAATADALLAGLAADLQALRAGTGLAALGEEPVCSYCEARGLCRRDDWSSA